MAFDVKADGTIEHGRILFNASFAKSKPGAPDGMKVDKDGHIFAAGPGGVFVVAPDGTHLGTIDLGAPTGNVAWGEDGSSLFITANSSVFRLKLTTKGAGY